MEIVQISEINGLLKVQWNVRYFSYKLRCMAVPGKESNNPRTLMCYYPVFVVNKWKQ